MGYIAGILIVGIITYGFYSLCELFVRRKERIFLIEKMASGDFKMDVSRTLSFDKFKVGTSAALTFGCLFVGVGLGLFIACMIELNMYDHAAVQNLYERRELFNIMYPTLATTFGGIGLIVAYVVERMTNKNK